MTAYGFKPNPKQLVYNKVKALYGRECSVVINGSRPSPLDAKKLTLPTGTYYVEVFVNGQFIACTHHSDWRKAYKLLVVEVEKAYEASLKA